MTILNYNHQPLKNSELAKALDVKFHHSDNTYQVIKFTGDAVSVKKVNPNTGYPRKNAVTEIFNKNHITEVVKNGHYLNVGIVGEDYNSISLECYEQDKKEHFELFNNSIDKGITLEEKERMLILEIRCKNSIHYK